MPDLTLIARARATYTPVDPPLIYVQGENGEADFTAKLSTLTTEHTYDFPTGRWHTRVTAQLRRHTARGKPAQLRAHVSRILHADYLPLWLPSAAVRFLDANQAPATRVIVTSVPA